GKPFTDFVLEHHPKTSRRLARDEALELLRQEHERGHLHSAWFRDVMLDRFFIICNCCTCCCGGVEAMVKYNAPSFASSGYVARVDASRCEACGKCGNACPFGAIRTDTTSLVQWDKCMGCEVCVSQCPNGAVSLVRDEKKGVPFDVRLMT
ncbi:MAG TPA: 4Fe-4S binding protein, partial [Nitrospirota bacterium]|nr:4Fe-4S binding protein [Nitrospirota bacterium]